MPKKLTRAERKHAAELANAEHANEPKKVIEDKSVAAREDKAKHKEQQIEEIIHTSFLKNYLSNSNVTDINYDGVKVTILDNLLGPSVPKKQPSQDDVRKLLNQIANIQGKQLNNSSPIMDTEIGYLRVNAVDQSVSPDGMTFSIRVSRPRLAIADISKMTVGGRSEVEALLRILVSVQSNIIISGETGTGKTEVQKLLVNYIDDNKLIVLIEDTRDSHIKALYPKKNIKSWQTLSSDDRDRKIEIHDLVKAGLRNFPDWMLVSETRGSEAGDMLDSAKTGHSIITTLHATSAMDIPSRLMSMIRQSSAYAQVSDMIVGREVTKFLRFGIHLEAVSVNGATVRRIKEIVEYTDFKENGPVGNYLYRTASTYDEQTETYAENEYFDKVSQETMQVIQDRRMYHMLPDLFKPEKKVAGAGVLVQVNVEPTPVEKAKLPEMMPEPTLEQKPEPATDIQAMKARMKEPAKPQRPAGARPALAPVENKNAAPGKNPRLQPVAHKQPAGQGAAKKDNTIANKAQALIAQMKTRES